MKDSFLHKGLRKKLVDEGLYKEDRPEDTIGNRIREALISIRDAVTPSIE